MTAEHSNPSQLMARADATLEDTVARLRQLLKEVAGEVRPFPTFYGSLTVQAVEAEPPEGQGRDLGCVVVCPDGELYELTVNFKSQEFGFSTSIERDEKVKKLDLPPLTYIPYAYNALFELTRLLGRGRRP